MPWRYWQPCLTVPRTSGTSVRAREHSGCCLAAYRRDETACCAAVLCCDVMCCTTTRATWQRLDGDVRRQLAQTHESLGKCSELGISDSAVTGAASTRPGARRGGRGGAVRPSPVSRLPLRLAESMFASDVALADGKRR
jgi:hypothetical protein